MAQVVRIRKVRGFLVQDCDVYIGNEIKNDNWDLKLSDWANPYWGTSEESLRQYEVYVRGDKRLMKRIEDGELNNVSMGCWCAPNPCHGDILLKIIKECQDKVEKDLYYQPLEARTP